MSKLAFSFHIKRADLYILKLFICCFLISSCSSVKSTIPKEILAFEKPEFKRVLKKSKYEFQLIYTRIIDVNGSPQFKSYTYNLDTTSYFYPASTIKMPTAFLAVERMNHIKDELGIDRDISVDLINDSIRPIQTPAMFDRNTITGHPNITKYIKEIFAVSDNDAYNRLYEFLGSDYINKQLQKKGIFSNSRIRHRVGVSGFTPEEQRHTNPIVVMKDDSIIYRQDAQYAKDVKYPKLNNTVKGKGYFKEGSKVLAPFDMSEKNFINLRDLESCMMHFLFPEKYPQDQLFDLTDKQRQTIKEAMYWVPRKQTSLNYNSDYYYDSYGKFFMYGDSKQKIPDHVRIYNKVGYAYGTLTDVAYIEDVENDISFFLTATILVNENEVFNDNKYEYDSIGIPFLAELGRRVYNYELRMKN